ncbi:hypothetical protein OQA88_1712 [Cercophora sp. LCS_1]
MFAIRPRAAFAGAARLTPAGPRRNLSQLTMGFENIAKWKEEKRRQQANRSRNIVETVYDIKIYTPNRLSNNWNISYPPGCAPAPTPAPKQVTPARSRGVMNSAVASKTTESERLSLISQFLSIVHISPTPSLIPQVPNPPAPPAGPDFTEKEDYDLPYDPVFSGPRMSAQITEVPSLSVLHKVVCDTPKAVDVVDSTPVALSITERPAVSPELFKALSRLGEVLALSRSIGIKTSSGNGGTTTQDMSIGVERVVAKGIKNSEKEEKPTPLGLEEARD